MQPRNSLKCYVEASACGGNRGNLTEQSGSLTSTGFLLTLRKHAARPAPGFRYATDFDDNPKDANADENENDEEEVQTAVNS